MEDFKVCDNRRSIAYALIGLQKYGDAIDVLSKLIQDLKGQQSEFMYDGKMYRAIAYANVGKYAEAIKDAEENINESKEYYLGYSVAGNIYAKKGDYKNALRCYDKAIELDKELGLLYFNRGAVEIAMGQDKSGKEDMKKASEMGCKYENIVQ